EPEIAPDNLSALGLFWCTLVSLPLRLLFGLDEEVVAHHVQDHYGDLLPDTVGAGSDPREPLPLVYRSLDQYKWTYTPLVALNTWAQIVQTYHEALIEPENSDTMWFDVNRNDVKTNCQFTTIELSVTVLDFLAEINCFYFTGLLDEIANLR